jgi:hypothetical protein
MFCEGEGSLDAYLPIVLELELILVLGFFFLQSRSGICFASGPEIESEDEHESEDDCWVVGI